MPLQRIAILRPAILLMGIALAPLAWGAEAVAPDQALFRAIEEGSFRQAASALDRGARAEAVDQTGAPALIVAVRANRLFIVQELLQRGASPNAQAADGSALGLAVRAGAGEMAKTLLRSGAKPGEADRTLVADAIRMRQYRLAALLIDAGADPNGADAEGLTPLMIVAREGNLDAVSMLLSRQADVNARDKREGTALYWAIREGKREIVDYLVRSGADLANVIGGSSAPVTARRLRKPELAELLARTCNCE